MAIAKITELRLALKAFFRAAGAAGGKAAAFGQIYCALHVALEDNALFIIVRVGLWYGGQKRLRVGMQHVAKQLAGGRCLDYLAEIHDRHGVACVLDDGHFVRDEHHCHAEFFAKVHYQV
ncbi:hypothetical protein SDC9_153075 [bioreactor metagenome]|uniref:Uncharacterized protein n=1 Tax=bioreactor metagenome TaxID=1076179 RepID=A0A645EUW4_9ZZZZ